MVNTLLIIMAVNSISLLPETQAGTQPPASLLPAWQARTAARMSPQPRPWARQSPVPGHPPRDMPVPSQDTQAAAAGHRCGPGWLQRASRDARVGNTRAQLAPHVPASPSLAQSHAPKRRAAKKVEASNAKQ